MGNEQEEIYSTSSKKPKLPKAPPQRGLGVARLEKILREQTHQVDDNNTPNRVAFKPKNSSLPLSHNFPITAPTLPPPPPPPPPPPLITNDSIIGQFPMIQNLGPFVPPPLPMTTLCGNSQGGGGDGGGGNLCLPTMWNSCEYFNEEQRKMDSGFPFPLYYLDTIDPFWPSNMNVSLPYGLSSSSSSIELPSNQKSYNYKSIWPEEPQMIGIKRQWPFALDNEPIPIPQKLPSCLTRLNKPDHLHCSCENYSTLSFEPFRANSRDAKKEGQAEQSSKKEIMDFETHDSSFLTLGPPSSSSQSTDEFNSTQILGSTGDSQQWSGQAELSHQETFYSLLLQKGGSAGAETASNLIDRRGEAAAENSIDLNLKMSVGSSTDDDQSLHVSKKSN